MATTKKAARKKAARKKTARKRKTAQAGALATGDVLERTFKGKTYRLRVTEEGFVLGKKTFRSLTAAAKHVTGYKSVSGTRWWLGHTEGGDA